MKLEDDPRYKNLLDGYMHEVRINRELKEQLEVAHTEKLQMIEELNALEGELTMLNNAINNAIREERVVN